MDVSRIYSERFDPAARARKDRIWQVLCRHFFQKYVRPTDTVLDLGAGYGEFLRHIVCAQRIAVDLNPDVQQHVPPGTRVLLTGGTDLGAIESDSVDVAFASNFFEHLPDKGALMSTLAELRRVLRPGGKLLVLQPNIRAVGGRYWDFIDHHIPLTDRSIVEALESVDLKVVEARPRFLPYTTKGRLPQHPVLIRLYLMFPFVHGLLGGQAWVVGVKPS